MPGRFLSPGKTRYPLYRRLVGPQGRSGQVLKISPNCGSSCNNIGGIDCSSRSSGSIGGGSFLVM